MPIRELPPSVYVVCDGCSRNLNTGSTDYDYTVFDAVEMPGALMDYDWCVTNEGAVLCHECASITASVAPDSFQDRDREERDPASSPRFDTSLDPILPSDLASPAKRSD